MGISLFDPKTSKVYDAPDEATATAQMRAYGLEAATPEQVAAHDAQARSGGTLQQLQTVPESAAVTISETLGGAARALTGGRAEQGGAFYSDAAKERREVNPGAAFAGALIPDVAAQALVPGVGAVSKLGKAASFLGRSVVGGLTAEGSETAIEGDQYSLGDAALYGLAAGALEAGGTYAFGKAMKAAGKTKDALAGAVDKARKFAIGDALAEPNAALRTLKMADNADELYGVAQTTLDDALGTINMRMAEAPEKMFNASALKKSVSDNFGAQSDHFLDLAVQLEHAANVSGVSEVKAARDILQEALESNGPKMYRAMRDARAILENADLAQSQLGKEVFGKLDESLRNEGIWGKAAKHYSTLADPGISVGPKSVGAAERRGFKVHDLDARESLNARLDAVASYASATGDKKAAKAVANARRAMAEADAVTGARVMGRGGPQDVYENTPAGRGARQRVPPESEQGGLWNRAKNYVNQIGEEEMGGFVEGGFKKAGMALGGAVGGVPGMALGYLGGRALNRMYGPRVSAYAWKAAKRGASAAAKKNPLRTAAGIAGAAAGAPLGGFGMMAGGYAGQRVAKGAQDVAKSVADKVRASSAGKRVVDAVKESARGNAAKRAEQAAAERAAKTTAEPGMRWTQTAPGESVDEMFARRAREKNAAAYEERALGKSRAEGGKPQPSEPAKPPQGVEVKIGSPKYEGKEPPPGWTPYKSADDDLPFEVRNAQMAERARAAESQAAAASQAKLDEALKQPNLSARAKEAIKGASDALTGAAGEAAEAVTSRARKALDELAATLEQEKANASQKAKEALDSVSERLRDVLSPPKNQETPARWNRRKAGPPKQLSAGERAMQLLAENPEKIAGAGLLGYGAGEAALNPEGSGADNTAAASVGLLAMFIRPGAGRRLIARELDDAMRGLAFRERAPMAHAIRESLEQNEELLRKFAAKELEGMTADDVLMQQGRNILEKFEEKTGKALSTEDILDQPDMLEVLRNAVDFHNAEIIENDDALMRLAHVGRFDALPGGGQQSFPFAQSPRDLTRYGIQGPADTVIREAGEDTLKITGEHLTPGQIRAWEDNLGRNLDRAEGALQDGDMPGRAMSLLNDHRNYVLSGASSNRPMSEALDAVPGVVRNWAADFEQAVGRAPNAREMAMAQASLEHRAGGYWAGSNVARLHVSDQARRLDAARAARDAGEEIGTAEQRSLNVQDAEREGTPRVMRELGQRERDAWDGELDSLRQSMNEENGIDPDSSNFDDWLDDVSGDPDEIIARIKESNIVDPEDEIYLRQRLGQDSPFEANRLNDEVDEAVSRLAAYADSPDETIDADDVIRMMESGETSGRLGYEGSPWEEYHLRRFIDDETDIQAGFERYAREYDETRQAEEVYEWERSNLRREPAGGDRTQGKADGLPTQFAVDHIGMNRVDMHDRAGIENVFGEDLSVRDMKDLFGLDHFKNYAETSGRALDTRLSVDTDTIEYRADVGDMELHANYKRTPDGLMVEFPYMRMPREMQAKGAMKEIVRPMIEGLERKGANEIQVDTAIEVGKHAWPAMGLRPSPEAEREAADSMLQMLREMRVPDDVVKGLDEQVRQASNAGKLNIRDHVADATIPVASIEHQLPRLRHMYEQSSMSRGRTFDEVFIDGDQFRAGKAFLLSKVGPWNANLRIRIDRNDPWYRDALTRLGLLGAAGLTGYEALKALSEGPVKFNVGEGQAEPQLTQEQRVELQQQADQEQRAQQTNAQLKYLKAQNQNAVNTAARAVASPEQNTRTVPRAPGVSNSAGVQSFMGSNTNLQSAFEEKKASLAKLQQNPMLLVDELTDSLSGLQETNPDLHRQVVAQTYKIASFLAEKMPGTIGASLTRPDGTPVSRLAVRQFALYYSAATQPSTVLADLTHNRAQKEQTETLKELWPETYNELKMAMIDQMSQGKPPPYAKRLRMDLLFDFGESLDTALSGRLVATHEAWKQTPAGQGKTKPDGSQAPPPAMPTRKSQPSIQGRSALASLSQGATSLA